MNIFGVIGQFIVKNQIIIQQLAIVLAICIGIYVIYKLIRYFINNNKRMDKITSTLDEINSSISDLSRQGDLIYIDNGSGPKSASKDENYDATRVSVASEKAASRNEAYYSQEEIVKKLKAISGRKDIGVVGSKEADGGKTDEAIETAIEKLPKFVSRSDSTDKNGKTYTIEEIEAMIRD